jgi:glutathione S-transferase
MADFTLHCFRESGNAYKAALMLQLCGADWEPHRVAFFTGETRGETIPRDERDGRGAGAGRSHAPGDLTLSQSGAILTISASISGKFGRNRKTRSARSALDPWDNHKLTSYSATYASCASSPARARRRRRSSSTRAPKARWKVLDRTAGGARLVAADRPTIADFSLCGYLFWPDADRHDHDEYPNITAWLDRIRALPGFKLPEDLMPSGQEPDTATA